jgi:5-methylcytosine-specific restriction endonuclease McrA
VNVEPRWKAPKRPSPAQRAKRLRELRTALFERASWTCEYPLCMEAAEVMHHRCQRSRGGSDELTNLMALCSRHHGLIHDNPTTSYAVGWLSREEP